MTLFEKLVAIESENLAGKRPWQRRHRPFETENMRSVREFLEENPITPEMLEELRKGNSVRVDAGRKARHSS
jgi:hypothetical protein